VPGAPELAELVEAMLDPTPTRRPRDGAAVLAALTPIEDRLRAKPADGSPPVHAKRRKATPGALFAEMKRRRVFRALLGYGIFAFAIIQVIEPVMHGLDLPGWVLRVVVITLGAGLPLTILLSWAYDLKGTGIVRAIPPWEKGTARRAPWRLAGLVSAGAVLGAGLSWLALRQASPPVPGVGQDGRIVVAVADTANETGEREMDALSGLLITALEQSRHLSVLPRGRLFDLARQAGHAYVARIVELIGREVGRKGGARALLVTSIHRLGATYAVQLRALDPAKDRDLFSAKETVSSKEAIFGLLDRLAERVRSELTKSPAETPASGTKPVGAPTTSLAAYEHYFRGQELDDRGMVQKAAVEYRKALEKDPKFALAHYALSVAVKALGATDEERRVHATAAMQGADQLPERERLLVQAWHAQTFWRFEEAHGLYAALVERYADDKRTLVFVGGILDGLHNDPGLGRLAAEKALALDPSYAPARGLLVQGLLGTDRLDEALAEALRWERETHSPEAIGLLAEVHRSRGDLDEALHVVRDTALPRGTSDSDRAALGDLRATIHLWRDELEAAWTDIRARPVPADASDWGAFSLPAELAITGGRPREAERLLAAAPRALEQIAMYVRLQLAAAAGPGLPVRAAARAVRSHSETADPLVAVALALAGEDDAAADVARGRAAGYPRFAIARFVEAMRRRWAGDPTGARPALEELRRSAPPFFLRQAATFALGEACHAAGDDPCAVEALRAYRLLYRPTWPLAARAWMYPRSLLLMARSQERLGDLPAALATVDHLLAMWKQAEPDFAPLAEAKALRKRLTAGAENGKRSAAVNLPAK